MIKVFENDVLHIRFEEDLIAPHVKEMEEKLHQYIEESEDAEEVVIELAQVENIDSMGITLIIGMYKAVTKDGRLFRVTGCNEDMRQLFKLMRLDDFFDIEEE